MRAGFAGYVLTSMHQAHNIDRCNLQLSVRSSIQYILKAAAEELGASSGGLEFAENEVGDRRVAAEAEEELVLFT